MGGWVTYDEGLAAVGARVASYPDHRGDVREGWITGPLFALRQALHGGCLRRRGEGAVTGRFGTLFGADGHLAGRGDDLEGNGLKSKKSVQCASRKHRVHNASHST